MNPALNDKRLLIIDQLSNDAVDHVMRIGREDKNRLAEKTSWNRTAQQLMTKKIRLIEELCDHTDEDGDSLAEEIGLGSEGKRCSLCKKTLIRGLRKLRRL